MDNLNARRILGYEDVAACPPGHSDQPMIDVRAYDPSVQTQYQKSDMRPYTGGVILVRDEVARRVASASVFVRARGLRLRVVYGYRHPRVQERYFAARRRELTTQFPGLTERELRSRTHAFVAVPDVAGHPTGGAVDLTLVSAEGIPADMGTDIADYTDMKRIETFCGGLSEEQRENRAMLLDAMTAAGFAPFLGEWWHFSYGDREWGAFYGRERALFGPVLLDPDRPTAAGPTSEEPATSMASAGSFS